jgi:hypothetical protein
MGFLTSHARVLLCLAHDPAARLRNVAVSLGITERSAQLLRPVGPSPSLRITPVPQLPRTWPGTTWTRTWGRSSGAMIPTQP